MPIAIVANGLRVAGTGIAAHYYGRRSRGRVLPHVLRLAGVRRGVRDAVRGDAGCCCSWCAPSPPARRCRASRSSPEGESSPITSRRPARHSSSAAALLAAATSTWPARRSAEVVPPRESLAAFPLDDRRVARPAGAGLLDPKILAVLGVDEYVIAPTADAGAAGVGLYIGYHASQRQGDTMHSPLNCLPGAGWQPIEQRVRSSTSRCRRQHGDDANRGQPRRDPERARPAAGLYWYQSHGASSPASTGARSTWCSTRCATTGPTPRS